MKFSAFLFLKIPEKTIFFILFLHFFCNFQINFFVPLRNLSFFAFSHKVKFRKSSCFYEFSFLKRGTQFLPVILIRFLSLKENVRNFSFCHKKMTNRQNAIFEFPALFPSAAPGARQDAIPRHPERRDRAPLPPIQADHHRQHQGGGELVFFKKNQMFKGKWFFLFKLLNDVVKESAKRPKLWHFFTFFLLFWNKKVPKMFKKSTNKF